MPPRDGQLPGDSKLPLKLDFDEFEDDYPEIENQRFYGFKQLSLANADRHPVRCRRRSPQSHKRAPQGPKG